MDSQFDSWNSESDNILVAHVISSYISKCFNVLNMFKKCTENVYELSRVTWVGKKSSK